MQASRIRDVDAKIQRQELVDSVTLNQYLRDIQTAERDKLQAADIILCTCTTSAARRIHENTNIVQVSESTSCVLLTAVYDWLVGHDHLDVS